MEKHPQVSITTLLYNSADGLSQCLQAIRPEVQSGFAQMLVVDNASPDASAEIAAREIPEGEIISSPINRGFAGGCNLAWPYVQAPYWLLLNPDVIVPQGGLRTLVAWMNQHPEIGVASPELVDSQGKPQYAARRFPSLSRALMVLLRLHLLLPRPRRADFFLGSDWNGSDHLNVDWVPGAAMIIRREAAEAVGLLSDQFFMYGEDMQWCWRMRNAGWRIGLCGQVQFSHQDGGSALRTWKEVERTQRILRGTYAVCQEIHGTLYTKLLMLVNTITLAATLLHPRLPPDRKRDVRNYLAAHRILWRKAKPGVKLSEAVAKR